MEKCGELHDDLDIDPMLGPVEGPREIRNLIPLDATDEYKRLQKYIVDLSPDEIRELKAIVDVGDKKLRTSNFVQECNRPPVEDNPLAQVKYLMEETLLFKSIFQGIDALVDGRVVQNGVFAEFDGGLSQERARQQSAHQVRDRTLEEAESQREVALTQARPFRWVTIRPTEETALHLIGDKYPNAPANEGFLFEWGYLWETVQIGSWNDLEIAEGYELASEEEREEYEGFLESKGRADGDLS